LKRRKSACYACLLFHVSLSLSLSNSVRTRSFVCFCVFMICVTRRVRIANHMVMDSCCRGGIVNTRGGCSCTPLLRRDRPNALWRFRASTSNSLNGRTLLHTYTQLRYIYHTYAQQDIRVCEDDLLKPPKRQSNHPKAL